MEKIAQEKQTVTKHIPPHTITTFAPKLTHSSSHTGTECNKDIQAEIGAEFVGAEFLTFSKQ